MNQKDADSYNDMMGTAVIPDEALKIDMGVAVSVEEKQAISDMWPDEERIDIISQNGNTGEHYEVDYLDELAVPLKGGDTIAVNRGLHRSGFGSVWDVISGGSGG